MYPSRFRYEAARSLDQATRLLRDGGDEAKVLAGGQSLIPMMKLRFASPELLVDINTIPGLDYHRVDPDGSIHVGALCRHADLEHSELLASRQPTMAAAAPLIADPLVRNRGTLVGSLCHADPQGDWASVVLALGGSIVAHGPDGRRTIPSRGLRARPVRERARARRDRGGGDHPGATRRTRRRLPEAGTPGRRLRHRRGGGGDRDRRRHGDQGRDRAHRSGRIDDRGDRGGTGADRPPADRGHHRGGGRLAAEAAQPKSDHRGSATYKRHMVRTFVVRILSRVEGTRERAA